MLIGNKHDARTWYKNVQEHGTYEGRSYPNEYSYIEYWYMDGKKFSFMFTMNDLYPSVAEVVSKGGCDA